MPALQLKVERAVFLQERKIAKDILFDLMRLGFGIDLLQIQNNLLDGVLAVAALDNFEAWAIQAEGTFRHEQHTLLVVFAESASGRQARAAVQFKRHLETFTIPSLAGKRLGAASLD